MRDDGQDRGTDIDPAGTPGTPWLHGTWEVVRVDGSATAGVPGSPWLTFDGDGVVFGHAGVNRVRGTWRLDGTDLTFGPVVATLMAGPPEATDTERALLDVLRSGGALSHAPGAVTVRTADGRVAELVRAPAPPDEHA